MDYTTDTKKLSAFPASAGNFSAFAARPKIGFLSKYSTRVILAIFVLFALGISLFALLHQSLRLDEAQSLWQSNRSPTGILYIIAQDVHVPLYGILLHYWLLFIGNSVTAGRIFSLFFFLLSIPAIYLLGKTAYNKSLALFVALLFSISPFLNWYGNETRMYSMLTLFTILNQYFFIRLFHKTPADVDDKNGAGNKSVWAGYILTALVGIYIHYFFWLILLTQVIYFLFSKKLFPNNSLRKFAATLLILVVALSPWLYYVKKINTASNASPVLLRPTTINVFNAFSQFFFGFQDDHINTLIISLWPLVVIFGFLSLSKRQKILPVSVYFFLSAILPIAFAFAISVAYMPLFITRYLILTIPSLYLFLAWSFESFTPRISAIFKTVLVASMVMTLIVQVKAADNPAKENYEGAAQYLSSHTSPQDVIVISAPFTVYPVEYYYDGPSGMVTLPLWNRFVFGAIPKFSEQQLPAEVDQVKAGHERVFLLLSYDQGYEQKIKTYFDTHFPKIYEENFSPKLNLYVYQINQNNLGFNSLVNSTNQSSPVSSGQ